MMVALNAALWVAVVIGGASGLNLAPVAVGANTALGLLLRFPMAYYFK
jgi:hypothetical protein